MLDHFGCAQFLQNFEIAKEEISKPCKNFAHPSYS